MGGSDNSAYLSSTEILYVNSMTWASGPSLPIAVAQNRGVESKGGVYSGFSTGGYNGQYQSKVYGLRLGLSSSWEELQSMTTARSIHSVVNAPKSIIPNC